jgi:tetratricopeptide (TPR) repeat protein
MGNYSRAIDIANQALRQNPTDFGALEIKAMSFIYLGKNNAALNILNTLVSEGHAVRWVLDDRAVSLMGLHNYVGAISNLNNAIAMEPNDAYALFNRAEAFLNMDFYSQPYSIQQLERHHHHPLIFSHLDAALQDLNKVLSIDPYDKDARDLKSLLIEGLKLGYIKNGSNTVGTTPSISNKFSSNNGTEEMKVLNWKRR